MIRGLGERSQTGEKAKAESGGFTQENMSQVPFAGNAARTQELMRSSAQMAEANRARAEEIARKKAEVERAMQHRGDGLYDLNRTVMGQAKKMGVEPAVKLDTGSQQQKPKRSWFFGRKTG